MSKPLSLLEQIIAAIRAIQERDQGEEDAHQRAVTRREDSHMYHRVEIGWRGMQLKEALPHGNAANQHAAKNKNDNLSFLFFEGFEAGCQAAFDIDPKQMQRYMQAARNAGLTAESTQADMDKLRETDALAGKTLSKLYVVPGEKPAPLTPFEEARDKMRFAVLRLTQGKLCLLERLHTEIMEEALPAFLPPAQIENLYHKLAEATEKVGAMRQVKRRVA